ncbi:MAG: recombinase RecA, partial [Treponemataceae bacterium]|nr:recombinase RecA [Treponemataceae bacterium]
AIDGLVVDSVAALTPKSEIDGEMGARQVGLQARLMSQALRKLTAIVGKSKCIIVFINQIRMKIGVMFGNPETTTGGNALKFYSSVRLEIRRIESIDGKGEEDAVGNRVRVKVVKNKVAPPFRKVELDIYFGKGVSATASLLDSAVKHGMIDKRGAWYTRGEEKVGQGKENAINFLAQNPDYAHTLEVQLRSELFPGQVLKNKEGVAVYPEQEKAVKAAAKAAKDAKPAADSAVSVTPAGTAAAKPESAAAGVSAKDALF